MTQPILPLESFDDQPFRVSDTWKPDLDGNQPRTLKEWAIPIPYTVLLAPNFEVEPRPFRAVLLDGIDARPAGTSDDLRVPGPDDGVAIYERLFPIFADAFAVLAKLEAASADGDLLLKEAPHVLVHPFKLAVYLSAYAGEMRRHFEVRDQLSELLDKLFLIGVMPHIFSRLDAYLRVEDGQVKQASAQAFLDAIQNDLESRYSKMLSSVEFFGAGAYLPIEAETFAELLTQGRDFHDLDQVLMPLNQLDEILSARVAEAYKVQVDRSRNQAQGDAKALIDLVASWPGEEVMILRRPIVASRLPALEEDAMFVERAPITVTQHHWLYRPVRDAISGHFVHGLSLNTLEFDHGGFTPPPTVTDDIDLRPTVWAPRAFRLAGDLLVLRKRTALGRKMMEEAKDLEAHGEVDGIFLDDWRRLGRVLADLDALRAEVAEYGYDIDLDAADDSGKTRLGLFRTRRYQYQQRVIRYRIQTIRHKKRVGPFWHRRTRRWTTRHRVPYFATVTKVREEQVPIAVDWDPIASYLDQTIDPAVYSIEGPRGEHDETRSNSELQRLRESIRAMRGESIPDGQLPRNRDKDYRVFSMADGQLTDQYGNPLESVMEEADEPDVRRLLLLLLPVVERDESGRTVVVAFKAIHNPVGYRNSYSTPEIAFFEAMEHRVREAPQYFIGPLAHTETLLPGERRSLNVRSETSFGRTEEENVSRKTQTSSKSSSSIQNQVRQEVTRITRRAQQSSWRVSASAGVYIGFAKIGGSAGGAGSTSRSTENRVGNLTDHLTKVMSEVSQRNELTITTSSTQRESFESAREQQVEIENYNTGRSVTHRFHQVLRRFESRSRLSDVHLVVTYDREFVAGYGYRRAEVLRLDDLDNLLPEFVEAERALVIAKLKETLVERHAAIQYDEDTGVLTVPEGGIELPSVTWHVNSGSYVIETDLASNEVLEDYVAAARDAQNQRSVAERTLLESQAKAIEAGRVVYPAKVDELRLTAPILGDRGA